MIKKHLYVALLFILSTFSTVNAQPQWSWGIRGGAPLNTMNPSPYEDIVDMATDIHGNVYFLALVKADLAPTMTGYTGQISNYGADDMLLASYDCKGRYRWHKTIGGYSHDMPLLRGGMALDSLGGVYISSMVYSPGLGGAQSAAHFGTDTVLARDAKKKVFLAKYDTLGVFQWLRMPEPDTTALTNSITMGLDVEPAGNAYVHIASYGGKLSGANITLPGEGNYILKFSGKSHIS